MHVRTRPGCQRWQLPCWCGLRCRPVLRSRQRSLCPLLALLPLSCPTSRLALSVEAWERDRAVEKRLLIEAAEVHSVSASHAMSLYHYAERRTLDGPVRLANRSMIAEAAEEIADLANYLRWEIVRTDRPEWAQVVGRVLGDVVLAWSTLEQAAHLAADMSVPLASLNRTGDIHESQAG